jgi:hypothetical protein
MTRGGASPKGRKKRTDQLVQLFQNDFVRYQYEFIEFLLGHLTDMSRTFRGDLHLPILLGLIGQARLKEVRAVMKDGRDLHSIHHSATTISASRLADVSGIPRETVRRKLAALKSKGWIEQTDQGSWFLTVDPDGMDSRARRDLAGLDERSLMRVADFVAGLEVLRISHTADHD